MRDCYIRALDRQSEFYRAVVSSQLTGGHQPLTCPGSPTPAPPLAAERQRGEGPVFATAADATDERLRDV